MEKPEIGQSEIGQIEQIKANFSDRLKNIQVKNPDSEIGKWESFAIRRYLPDVIRFCDYPVGLERGESAFVEAVAMALVGYERAIEEQKGPVEINSDIRELVLKLTATAVSNDLKEPVRRGEMTWFKDRSERIKEVFRRKLGNYSVLEKIPLVKEVERVISLKEPACNTEAASIQSEIAEKERVGFWEQAKQTVSRLYEEYKQERGKNDWGIEDLLLLYMAEPLSSVARDRWEHSSLNSGYWEADIPWFLVRYAVGRGIPEDFTGYWVDIKRQIYNKLRYVDPTREQVEFVQKCFAVYRVPKELFEKGYPEYYRK